MNNLQQLISDINNFDTFYSYSDSDAVWKKGNDEKIKIESLIDLYKPALTDSPEVSLYRKKYFDIPFSRKEQIELKQLLTIINNELQMQNLIPTVDEAINLITK